MVWKNENCCLIFKGSSLKQKNATFNSPNLINIFITYKLETRSWDLNSSFNLKDCLFAGAKLATNADPDKYVYSVYGIEFDTCSKFSLTDSSVGKSVIIQIQSKRFWNKKISLVFRKYFRRRFSL